LLVVSSTASGVKLGTNGGVGSFKQHELFVFSRPFTQNETKRGAISDLPDHATGTMLTYEPSAPENTDLFVFLPGSNVQCANYTQLLSTIGKSMYTLCLPYDNADPVGILCLGTGFDNDCFYKARETAVNGSFKEIEHNNIEERLSQALKYLSWHKGFSNTEWSRFLEKSHPKWSKVRVGGHSQGAGDATMIGYQVECARVIQFTGPCDASDWPVKLAPPRTPGDRFFAFGSGNDLKCLVAERQIPAWRAQGALEKGEEPIKVEHANGLLSAASSVRHGKQVVVSYIQPPRCAHHEGTISGNMGGDLVSCAHDSVALNTWPGGESGDDTLKVPYAKFGLWQALLGV
jgi:hypothetical protein